MVVVVVGALPNLYDGTVSVGAVGVIETLAWSESHEQAVL